MRFFCFSWFYFIFPLLAITQEVKIYDRAMANSQGGIIFLSDLQQLLTDVKSYRCAVPSSFLLEVLVLGPYQLPELSVLKEVQLEQNLELVGKLIKLSNLRTQVWGRERHSEISEKQVDFYRKKFTATSCGATSWQASITHLYLLDDYLQERFKDGDLTSAERTAWKLKNLTISASEVEKRLAKRERDVRINSAQNYLHTLNEQLTIQKYY